MEKTIIKDKNYKYIYYAGQSGLFLSIGLIQSISVTYLISNGISVKQIGFIWAVYLFAVTLLDFPTGMLADRIGKLRCWCLGLFITGVSQVLYGLTKGFAIYMTLSIVGALGEALLSGSLIAWVTSKAVTNKLETGLPKVFGTGRLIASLTRILGGIVASFLVIESLRLPYIAAGLVSILISAVLVLFDKEKLAPLSVKESTSGMKVLFFDFFRNPIILGLAILSITTMSLHSLYQLFWQPRLLAIGINMQLIGIIYSGSVLMMGIGSYISGILYDRRTNVKLAMALASAFIMSSGILMIGVAQFAAYMAAGILLYNMAFGFFFPVFESWSNEQFSEESRAAANSLMSTVSCSAVAVIQAGLGIAYEKLSMLWFSLISFLLLFVAVLTIAKMFALKHNSSEVKTKENTVTTE